MPRVSDRIRQIKERFQLNNVELAKAAGVTKQAVGQWINQDATPDGASAVRLKESLGINESWLISGKGEMLNQRNTDELTKLIATTASQLSSSQKEALLQIAREFAIQNSQ